MPLHFDFYWLADRFLFRVPFLCFLPLAAQQPHLSLVCPLQAMQRSWPNGAHTDVDQFRATISRELLRAHCLIEGQTSTGQLRLLSKALDELAVLDTFQEL